MTEAAAAVTAAPTVPTPRVPTARRKIVGDTSGRRRRGRVGVETDPSQRMTGGRGAGGRMEDREKDTIQEAPQRKGRQGKR